MGSIDAAVEEDAVAVVCHCVSPPVMVVDEARDEGDMVARSLPRSPPARRPLMPSLEEISRICHGVHDRAQISRMDAPVRHSLLMELRSK
ncbi:hypothetical protein ACLOJK_032840 [Asimina triloba]